MKRHVGVAAFGLAAARFRVVAVVADSGARRLLLRHEVEARSAHGAVLHALETLARSRQDATPLDVFVCQQSVQQACENAGAASSLTGAASSLAGAKLTVRWHAKARASEVPALERALHLVTGGAA